MNDPAKPVASMTDDAAMLIRQPGDDVPLDNLEKIVGRSPALEPKASYVAREHVVMMCDRLGWDASKMETATGSPQLRVRMPGGPVNITFTMARS